MQKRQEIEDLFAAFSNDEITVASMNYRVPVSTTDMTLLRQIVTELAVQEALQSFVYPVKINTILCILKHRNS